MNSKIEKAFNEQMKEELASAYIYLQMAGWLFSQGYDGMAHWMLVQRDEELMHAQKFFDHIAQRGGLPLVLDIPKPGCPWKTPLEIFQAAYKHEQFITSCINKLVKLAREEDDFAAVDFLQWFVREQVEEEANTSKIFQMLERIGNSSEGLVMADKELAARPAFVPPPAAGQN